jgi:hypothetical protein
MARIRVRFEMNRGRTGAPMEKLGEISRQAEKFLRSLAADVKLTVKKGEWLAVNFENGSVSYDAEFQGEVNEGTARAYLNGLRFVADYDADVEGTNGIVTDATLLEYARIGQIIDPDEVIGIGLYDGRSPKPKWRTITYNKTSQIRGQMEAPISSYGSVQGIIYSLIKEADKPNFRLRELATDHLVRCYYTTDQYPQVYTALRERSAVVHVSGNLTLDRITRTVTIMDVDRIDQAEALSGADFERFFGSSPLLTGDMETEEFIELARGNGE